MKRRKKPKRKSRKRIYGVVAVVIVFFCILTYSFLHLRNQTNIHQDFSYKAAIVDHLSLYVPNPTFNQTASTILKKAGYTVDYYSGEEVNVEFYRNLPTHDYGLIILRVHSTATMDVGTEAPVTLYTSERVIRTKYVYEQLTDQLVWVTFPVEEEREKGSIYFGVCSPFVTQSMKSRFKDTIIIMMGCEGLKNTEMAEAFIEKGARAYISWDEGVLASHTDKATIDLLRRLVVEKQTIKKAVTQTMEEVGPDPMDGSTLQYYPNSVDNYVIPNIASNSIPYYATISGYDSSFIMSMFIILEVEK